MRVIGHRGASALAPENTVAAIERAVRDGADAVEVDVRLSADGRLVVVHDGDLARTTDGEGIVERTPVERIRSFDAGARFAGPAGDRPWLGRGLRVPLLDEAWDAAEGRLVLEVKGEWGTDVAPLAAAALAEFLAGRDTGSVVVSSFDLRAVALVRERSAGVRTGVLTPAAIDAVSNVEAAVAGEHAVCFLPDAVATPESIEAARSAGRDVVVWTVDDPARLRALRDWGAGGVIADDPGAARGAIAS